MKISQTIFKIQSGHVYGRNGHFQYSKGNNCKSRKTRVTVHVFCVSSHGVNIVSSFMKICQAVLKLWRRHTHTQKRKLYTPMHAYLVCLGYNQSYDSCVLHVVLWLKVCMKFHENMSSGFKVMEQTQKLLTHKGQ